MTDCDDPRRGDHEACEILLREPPRTGPHNAWEDIQRAKLLFFWLRSHDAFETTEAA